MGYKLVLFFYLTLYGFVASAGLLNIPLQDRIVPNTNNEIELCWLTVEDSETRDIQKKIEIYVREQIQQYAGLKISFVGLCLQHSNPMGPIGIAFYDSIDNTKGIQNTILGVVDKNHSGHPTTYNQGRFVQDNLLDIVLSFRWKDVRPSLVKQALKLSQNATESLFLSIALHEILHALGLSHEHNRPDAICNKEKDNFFHPQKDVLVGNYDLISIMNICYTQGHNFEKNGPIKLSDGDIQVLQLLYSDL